jgi:hypothetical protein
MRDHLTDRQIQHRAYLQSPLWRKIRLSAIKHYGEVCGKCGCYGNDVHHLTYDRVGGNELLEDLQVLCRDCHEAIHAIERTTRRQKSKRRGCTVEVLYSKLTNEHKRQIEERFGGNAYATLISPSPLGWSARKMARRFLNIQFIVSDSPALALSDPRQMNSINQFYYREEYKKLKSDGLLTQKKANDLRKKYFSVDKN